MKTEHDDKLIRCPKLGDEMTFAYCLREAGDFPCSRIILCWSPPLDCICIMGSINSIYGTKLFNHLPNKELIKSMAPQKQNLYCEKDPTL